MVRARSDEGFISLSIRGENEGLIESALSDEGKRRAGVRANVEENERVNIFAVKVNQA